MYAIIKDGGRQYKVEEGQEIEIDYRGDAQSGSEITFDQVLCTGGNGDTRLGTPLLSGVSITAQVIGASQGPKLVVQKFRRRKNSRRKTGHRQLLTKVKIGKIA
ncbi:MAG: 50S ribosomal protein L21 [Planctomycetota bacterium]|nr:50S ribosomal protein L21 [Planctomycetota bacterium]